MDALAEEGTVVLGGPVGDGDGEDTLLVVDGRKVRRRSAPASPTIPGGTRC